MDKETLRKQLRDARDAFAAKEGETALQVLCKLVFQSKLVKPAHIVAGYQAMRGEVDPAPILTHYQEAGHRCCLPVTCFGTRILQFRESGIPDSAAGLEIIPDIIFVPMVGFDHRGYRLGQGGGHYDSTLDHLRESYKFKAVGLAYDCQEVDQLPIEIHDQRMDCIITPTRVLGFSL